MTKRELINLLEACPGTTDETPIYIQEVDGDEDVQVRTHTRDHSIVHVTQGEDFLI